MAHFEMSSIIHRVKESPSVTIAAMQSMDMNVQDASEKHAVRVTAAKVQSLAKRADLNLSQAIRAIVRGHVLVAVSAARARDIGAVPWHGGVDRAAGHAVQNEDATEAQVLDGVEEVEADLEVRRESEDDRRRAVQAIVHEAKLLPVVANAVRALMGDVCRTRALYRCRTALFLRLHSQHEQNGDHLRNHQAKEVDRPRRYQTAGKVCQHVAYPMTTFKLLTKLSARLKQHLQKPPINKPQNLVRVRLLSHHQTARGTSLTKLANHKLRRRLELLIQFHNKSETKAHKVFYTYNCSKIYFQESNLRSGVTTLTHCIT